ncbi:DUF2975 domain-containing protein [Flavobacterium sp. GA093]|uniref:DUF2975 domain-containing protein n=1 Tax=Flavobacterium hydrocarbonoxydans TaxID=2683249 RepID=A0A6I4NLV3_9FLAO|nr:DUF2975 domain-containing protein [Flavobacterium hydrocarbonoxydans]MWB95418.1 DUF2975 domain-containing protein [Flavobacterium hydrocarbonoxydans]
MEIKISTQQILNFLLILSYIIFFGVCFEAGGFICNAIYIMMTDPIPTHKFWAEFDLTSVYHYDAGHFLVMTFFMSITAIMKALIFYLIIKILHDKKLNMLQPFTKDVVRFVFSVAYLTLGIGLFSSWGAKYSAWLISLGVEMPQIQVLRLAGADVWFFMSITLFVIAQIFKRGIEIQSENELTI